MKKRTIEQEERRAEVMAFAISVAFFVACMAFAVLLCSAVVELLDYIGVLNG